MGPPTSRLRCLAALLSLAAAAAAAFSSFRSVVLVPKLILCRLPPLLLGFFRRGVLAQRPARFKGKSPKSIHIYANPGPGVKLDQSLFS